MLQIYNITQEDFYFASSGVKLDVKYLVPV